MIVQVVVYYADIVQDVGIFLRFFTIYHFADFGIFYGIFEGECVFAEIVVVFGYSAKDKGVANVIFQPVFLDDFVGF